MSDNATIGYFPLISGSCGCAFYLLIVTQQWLNGQDALDDDALYLLPQPCKAKALLFHPPSACQQSGLTRKR